MKSLNKIYYYTDKTSKVNMIRMQRMGYREVGIDMLNNPMIYKQISFIMKTSYNDFIHLYHDIELIELMELYTIHLAQNYKEPEPEQIKK